MLDSLQLFKLEETITSPHSLYYTVKGKQHQNCIKQQQQKKPKKPKE